MPHFGQVKLVEFLAVSRAKTDLDGPDGRQVIVVTIRPDIGSWRPLNLALTWNPAERLKTDLEPLLKAPAAFLMLAILALASGCAARVEVVSENSAAAEAESAAAPPVPALEKRSVVVDVDFLEQPQLVPAVEPVASGKRVAMPKPVPVNLDGIQVNGDKNTIEFHFHRHRRSRSPVMVCPVTRHEMVIVPSDGSAPVVFMDNAPPTIAMADKEVARAYAEHILRLAEEEGQR